MPSLPPPRPRPRPPPYSKQKIAAADGINPVFRKKEINHIPTMIPSFAKSNDSDPTTAQSLGFVLSLLSLIFMLSICCKMCTASANEDDDTPRTSGGSSSSVV